MSTKDIDDFFMAEDAPAEPPRPEVKQKAQRAKKQDDNPGLTFEPPASIDAEKTILGSILLDNDFLKQVSLSIDPDDFFLDSHRIICRRMKDLFEQGKPIDIVTLSQELKKHKEIQTIGGVSYLAGLTE